MVGHSEVEVLTYQTLDELEEFLKRCPGIPCDEEALEWIRTANYPSP